MTSFFQLLIKGVQKPYYIWLCVWSFVHLWWIDFNLQALAIEALKFPDASYLPPLSESVRRQLNRRVAAISWVSHFHPCKPKCLHQSLAIFLWLRYKKIPCKLMVGWGQDMGHAWVSYGGDVLNDVPSVLQSTPPLLQIKM